MVTHDINLHTQSDRVTFQVKNRGHCEVSLKLGRKGTKLRRFYVSTVQHRSSFFLFIHSDQVEYAEKLKADPCDEINQD